MTVPRDRVPRCVGGSSLNSTARFARLFDSALLNSSSPYVTFLGVLADPRDGSVVPTLTGPLCFRWCPSAPSRSRNADASSARADTVGAVHTSARSAAAHIRAWARSSMNPASADGAAFTRASLAGTVRGSLRATSARVPSAAAAAIAAWAADGSV